MQPKNLVTNLQAEKLKQLGFNDCVSRYIFSPFGDEDNTPKTCTGELYDWNNNSHNSLFTSLPTVDEAIDWLRRKFDVIIWSISTPFVDPKTKDIMYSFGVKQCNKKWGWNHRVFLGRTPLHKDIYIVKRKAINIALTFILNQYESKKSKSNPSASSKKEKRG